MRQNRRLFAVAPLLLLAASVLHAQMGNDHVSWELLTPTVSGKPGEVVNVEIRLIVAPKAHIYSLRHYPDSVLGPVPTEITAGESGLLERAGDIVSGTPATQKRNPNFDDLLTEYWEGTVILTVPVRIAKKAKQGEHQGWVNVYFMTCNDRFCRPPTDRRFAITVRVKRK